MAFNIETYLNSLPLYTTCIVLSNKNLKILPDLTRFKQLTHLFCNDNHLTWLPPLNNTLIQLDCSGNKLTELPPLNNNLTQLYCSFNCLTSLPPLNNNLTHLYCSRNQLTELPPLNNNLKILNCSFNQLISLPPLNNTLTQLYCSDNNIYNENIEKYKYDYRNIKIIQTLCNFRYTYYCLKYKNHFKRWLWEKVREPKIMAKFHPSHLTHLLDSDDLEVFLDDWINK